MRTPLLSVRDLRVGFPSQDGTNQAVDGLSFDLPAGGSLAIVGESGSGKTVSVRALLRLLPANAVVSGEARFEGADLIGLGADELRAVRGRRIGMVFQNAMEALNPTLTLKRQLTEHLLWHGICGRKQAVTRAIEALDRVGIPEPHRRVKMYPFQLSGGMRQRAMIAMAIVAEPTLLIADEPTTAVDVTLQRQVLDLLADLRRDGLSIIAITHDLGVARYSCEDVVVMRHGRVVERASMATFAETAAQPYSRQLLEAALDVHSGEQATSPNRGAQVAGSNGGASPLTYHAPLPAPGAGDRRNGPLLRARRLTKDFEGRAGTVRAVDNVSLSIAEGETVGVVGESGSGKSTLARLLLRLVEPTSGTVVFDGADLSGAGGRQLFAMRRQVQMVFQNPYGSLLPHLTVAANVAEPLRVHKVGRPAQRRVRALELLDEVGIPRARADQYPRQFSGGQQQRIAIARALALEPRLLICDEPTSALDVSIQAQILALLADLRHRLHLSMLFVTHNLAVAQRVSDRIVVMRAGRIVETAPTAELFAHPAHPYTRALLAAVLPVRGQALAHTATAGSYDAGGELTEVSPDHLVRMPQNSPAAAAGYRSA